jgi:hypothetical protein
MSAAPALATLGGALARSLNMRRFARGIAMVLGGLRLTKKAAFTRRMPWLLPNSRRQFAFFVIAVTALVNHQGNNRFRRVNF